MSKNKLGLKLLKYLGLTAAFCLLRLQGEFDGMLAFGLYVGVLYTGAITVPSLLYIICGLLSGLNGLYVALGQAAVMVAASLLHLKAKRKINRLLLLLYALLSNVFYFVYRLTQEVLWQRLGFVAIGVAFCFVCVYALRAVFVRGLRYRAGADEKICIHLLLLGLFRGLTAIVFFEVSALNLVAPFLILFALFCGGAKNAFCFAVNIGLAFALSSGQLAMAAIPCLWAAAAVAFCSLNRFLSVFSLLLTEVVLAYFFEIYGASTTATLVCTVTSCALFCCIPNFLLKKCASILGEDKTLYSPKSIVNRLRVNLSRRLFDLSEVFFSMKNSFKSLSRGVLPPEKAVFAISNEVADNACKDCPQKLKCWRTDAETTQKSINKLVECGIDRGKVTLLDLSPELATKCLRVSTLMSATNFEVANYKQYYLVNSSYDNSRALLSDVSEGISHVLLCLSQDNRATLCFDSQKEKVLIEQLTFFNVLVKEAALITGDNNLVVTLVVDKKDADKPQIEEIVSKVCGFKLCCKAKETFADDNWTVLYFSPKPRFDLSVGIAATPKKSSEISGDTHSFLRLNDDRYLLALCDGMGSGQNAEKASATAIGLLENFYCAGFDNDLILTCINKLLAAANTEVFTAVDACIVDLKNGAADFIKLGAPIGVVKCGGTVQFVEGTSLPIGVLEEIKPTITKKVLGKNDFLLIASDGFWDSFADKTMPALIFDQCQLTNPQAIAQNLLELSLAQTAGVANDDITILVAKVF